MMKKKLILNILLFLFLINNILISSDKVFLVIDKTKNGVVYKINNKQIPLIKIFDFLSKFTKTQIDKSRVFIFVNDNVSFSELDNLIGIVGKIGFEFANMRYYIFNQETKMMSEILFTGKAIPYLEGNLEDNDKTSANENIQKYESDEDKFLVIHENSILFFTLSKSVYNTFKIDERLDVDEILGDFYSFYRKVIPILEEKKVNVLLSAADKFIFQNQNGKSEKFNWASEMKKQIVGIAFFGKDKKPRIEFGVFDDPDIIRISNEYFGSIEGMGPKGAN